MYMFKSRTISADSGGMDPESPTSAPASVPARRERGGGILGLPARLAFLTLVSVAACVAGITFYADHRMGAITDDRARSEGISTARAISRQFAEGDFDPTVVDDGELMRPRMEQVLIDFPTVRAVGLFSLEGAAKPKLVAESQGAPAGLADVASDAVRAGNEIVTGSGDVETVAYPVRSVTESVLGVVAIEFDTAAISADAATDRTRLVLGAVAGGSVLALLLLLLLRRELFRPLMELRRVMSQIRGGARGVRIGWQRSDELGAVASDFDAMVTQLEATQDELAKYVKTDPLTGLLTRAAFTERLGAELTRARREGYPIALLAIDIDELADINATHDTAAGDQVLAAIGTVINGCTRPTDACGRTGGDSFHVALVGALAARAAVVIQRIRAEIESQVGIGPERTRVTCGFGVAEYPTHAVDQLVLERMATAAVEQAQRQGRGHAVAFGESGGYVDAMTLVPAEERAEQEPTGQRELASTVHALARCLDGIDPALGGGAHSQRVARYAVAVGRELGLDDAALRELRSAAVLHDIGKVAVPPSILRLPETDLDDRQAGALRYQAWVGRTMIGSAGLPAVADIVFHLPERWDGTGYPERRRGDATPLGSRILHAAELLDQLLAGHAGAEPLEAFDAAGAIKRLAGTQLDPDVAVRLASLVRDEGLVATPQAASQRDAA
jgi:diguanylate cyclase (GGDEF)-like protein